MKMIIKLTFLLAIAAMVLNSCNDLKDDNGNATGNVTFKITDAPFPADFVEAALITVDRLELRKAGGDCPGVPQTEQSENDEDENSHSYGNMEFNCDSGFVSIPLESTELNLLELRNGITEVLANAELPVGEYDMIRLHIVDAEIVLDDRW